MANLRLYYSGRQEPSTRVLLCVRLARVFVRVFVCDRRVLPLLALECGTGPEPSYKRAHSTGRPLSRRSFSFLSRRYLAFLSASPILALEAARMSSSAAFER